ncbi:MAG: DUF637 domain-containing protein, partial [Rickettsiales bacterium]|nr:DUF637 domain-containing protein [Rickettsiales bacterium]
DYIINKGSIISNSDLTLTTTKANTTNPISSTLDTSADLQTYINDLLTINETNSTGIFNYGRIATADELNINSNSTLINYDEALIFSNNSMNVNVKDYFINYAGSLGTGLWSKNNILIYNSTSNSNIKTLANLGGTIESYAGNIGIGANELINSRISIPSQVIKLIYLNVVSDESNHWIYSYTLSGTPTRESQILSGNNLTINSKSFYNNASTMQAINDLSITTDTLSNTAYYLFTGKRENWQGKKRFMVACGVNGWECWGAGHLWDHYSQKYYYDIIYDLTSSIRSGGTNTIVATNRIDNGTIVDGQFGLSNNGLLEFDTALQKKQSDYINSIVSSGTLDPLANIDLPTGNYGVFAKSDDPNSHYLFETDPTLIDVSQFLGSKYFLNRLGIDPDGMEQQFLGDAYFDNQILTKSLQDQALQNMYDKATTNGETELTIQERIDAMYNNVTSELQNSLGLVVGEALTEEQLNNLTEDIVWYVIQTVDLGNGEIYEALVPQIFLSKAHRDLLQQMNDSGELQGIGTGSMIAGNNVSISTETDLNNTGNSIIVARNNLSIIADNDINNLNGALIKNLNNTYTTTDETTGETTTQNTTFQILAGNDINNIGSQIQANTSGTAIVYAENNINNETTKTRVNQPGGYKEVISNEASILNTGTGGSLLIQANTGDITNTGANISSDGTVQLVAGNDIVFNTLELESYSKIAGKKVTVETRDITNIGSSVNSENGSIVMQAGNNISMTGTNVEAKEDIDLTANNNVIIENAVDSHYSYVQNIKKGTLKKVVTTQVDYVETAVESNLNANNINITAGNIILVQGSNLNAVRDTTTGTGGDTNLEAGSDVYITDAVLQEYHYATKEVSNRGVYKGITAITSSLMSIGELLVNTALTIPAIVLSNIDDPIQKLVDPIAPDFISDNIDYDKLRNKQKDAMYENSLHNTKVRDTNTNTLTNIVSSNINTDNDLTISSTNSVTVQASNLNSDGAITINSQIFNVLADSSYNLATSETRTKRVMTIRNNTTGNIVTDITDSNIVSGSNNYNFNITDKVNIASEQDTGQQTLQQTYITALRNQIDGNNINQTDIQATSTHWEDTTRQMTDVGLATAAIAAVVAIVLTAGTATAGIGAAAGTAAGSAATAAGATAATAAAVASVTSTVVATAAMATLSTVAATLATSTAQASMNADGDFFKQAKDISKDTWDSTTSRDAFESYAIAALSGALTAGMTEGLNAITNGVVSAGNATGATLAQQTTTALSESAISTVSSTAVQSAMNGNSFGEALQDQIINVLINAVGEVGAKQIGGAYHTGEIGKPTQLTLHAALGCVTGALGGGDCASGAVSGVVGELAGETFGDSVYGKNANLTKQQEAIIKEIGGLAGAFSAIFTGNLVGLDDSEVAENMYSGQRIGKNAVENNYLLPQEKKDLVDELHNCKGDSACEAKVQAKYEEISDPRDLEAKQAFYKCIKGDCEEFNKINYDLKMKITKEGNEYYNSLTEEQREQEFIELPEKKAVYHTYQTDPNTGEVINVLTGSQEGYTKYVHLLYGYEIVLDSSGNIITDPVNIGTYNFYNPELENVQLNSLINGDKKHFKYDVLPYYLQGNSQQDTTTAYERLLRSGNLLFY